MREIEAYRRFKYVMFTITILSSQLFAGILISSACWCLFPPCRANKQSMPDHFSQDSAVVQDPEGEGKIVYLFLPLYKACLLLIEQPKRTYVPS